MLIRGVLLGCSSSLLSCCILFPGGRKHGTMFVSLDSGNTLNNPKKKYVFDWQIISQFSNNNYLFIINYSAFTCSQMPCRMHFCLSWNYKYVGLFDKNVDPGTSFLCHFPRWPSVSVRAKYYSINSNNFVAFWTEQYFWSVGRFRPVEKLVQDVALGWH